MVGRGHREPGHEVSQDSGSQQDVPPLVHVFRSMFACVSSCSCVMELCRVLESLGDWGLLSKFVINKHHRYLQLPK